MALLDALGLPIELLLALLAAKSFFSVREMQIAFVVSQGCAWLWITLDHRTLRTCRLLPLSIPNQARGIRV